MSGYADLEIRLSRRSEDSYTVELQFRRPDDDAISAPQRGIARFAFEGLDRHILEPKAYGQCLSQSLFADPIVRQEFREARAASEGADLGLRLRLHIDRSAPELHGLHWETLRDPRDNAWLLTSESLLFSRFLATSDRRPVRLRPKGDLRALVVVANPEGLAMDEWAVGNQRLEPVDVKGELERARKALGRALAGELVSDAKGLTRVTLSSLVGALRGGYDILYLVCHGALFKDGPFLYLDGEETLVDLDREEEKKDKRVDVVPGVDLVERLKGLDPSLRPRLLVLASCQSAGNATRDRGALAALGPRLVQEAGVPAVLAMQGNVAMETVARFMPVFFEQLCDHGQIDRAMAAARGAVLAQPDWWMPVLFMRLKDGQLWEGKAPFSIADLQEGEQRYRARIRDKYAEDAAYYIDLAGEATELAPLQAPSSAPRSARRRSERAAMEYHEWIESDRGIQRDKLNTLREGVDKYPCVILLGDPGSGKTTALENLAYQFADEPDRLPVLLRLSEYGPEMSLQEFIDQGWGGSLDANHWGAPDLAANLEGYLAQGRMLLLFDALNEMPQAGYETRVYALRRFIDQWKDKGNRFLVTCRVLDYREELSGLQRVEIQPLTDDQIQAFLRNELPQGWQSLWETLTEGSEDQRRLLEMARNPYLLTMMVDVYDEDGRLGRNRAELMDRFTRILLGWARAKCPPDEWLDADVLREVLSVLAYEAQDRSGFGTVIGTEQVKMVMPREVQLDPRWPAVPSPPDQVLSLAASAHIIEMPVDRSSVRFYHQLLQEYFAARELGKRVDAGQSLSPFWPQGQWWEPSRWEETFILLAGLQADASALIERLAIAHPVLAARCLLEGGVQAGEPARHSVVGALLAAMRDDAALPAQARARAGDWLAGLGDPRPGVGLRADGLPDIAWCEVPQGVFLMGSGDEDAEANWGEKPQHEVCLPAFRIARYPITHAQYAAFVKDGGYTEQWRSCWMDAGWDRFKWVNPEKRGDSHDLHHPVVGMSWPEAAAYCRWLTVRLREAGEIGPDQEVRLPSEAEWEKAARGTDARIYPWGNEPDPNRANYADTGIRTTSVVGCFPGGASPYGCEEMSGNVWEWCATKFEGYGYAVYVGDNDPGGSDDRMLRGGAFGSSSGGVRCACRHFDEFGTFDIDFGFRVCVAAR